MSDVREADLIFNFSNNRFSGSTTLWVVVHENLKSGDSIYLNCRQCKITGAFVNGIPTSYTQSDPIANLIYNSDVTYNGEEIDINYRAGLEISNSGELEIVIPKYHQPSEILNPLPKRAPHKIASKFDKLSKLQHNMTVGALLLQVKLYFIVESGCSSMSNWSFKSSSLNSRSIVCGYSKHGNIPIRNIDGIRTWLPCIDQPNCKAIFDISITLPHGPDHIPLTHSMSSALELSNLHKQLAIEGLNYRVMCSGMHISTTPLTFNMMKLNHITCVSLKHRYVTMHATPAHAIGIFFGIVEDSYNFPLHIAQGRLWTIANDVNLSTESEEYSNGVDRMRMSAPGTSSSHIAKRAKNSNSHLQESIRYSLLGFEGAIKYIQQSIVRRNPHDRYTIIVIPHLDEETETCLSFDGYCLVSQKWLHTSQESFLEFPCHVNLITAYLYSWLKVSLPIDSFNSEYLLHGSVGFLLHSYIEYCLGVEEARCRFQKQYDCVIAYEKACISYPLVNSFPENYHMYGGPYFREYLKNKSVVLMHIISHRIGSGSHSAMLRVIRSMVKSPSLNINTETTKRGDTDSMDMPPPSLMHSPPHSSSSPQYDMPPPSLMHSPRYMSSSPSYDMPPTPRHDSNMGSPEYTSNWMTSPSHEISYQSSPIYQSSPTWASMKEGHDSGNLDDSMEMEVSTSTYNPDVVAAALAHMEAESLPPETIAKVTSSTLSTYEVMEQPKLMRNISEVSSSSSFLPTGRPRLPSISLSEISVPESTIQATSGIDNVHLADTDRKSGINGIRFLALIRSVVGDVAEASELTEALFLDRWVYNIGCLLLRAGVHIDRKVKKLDIALQQIGYRNGEIKAQYSYQDKIIMNVAESEVFQYYKKLDRSIQLMSVPIQSKVRRSGRRKSVGDAVGSQAVYGAQALHHVRMGSANDLVAGLVHFLSLDPEVLWIREIHLTISDRMAVEQLYMDKDCMGQILILRNLAKASLHTMPQSSAQLRVRALYDILIAASNEADLTHCIPVRLEAAYALALWQNENAPFTGDTSIVSPHAWAGMNSLLTFVKNSFVDHVLPSEQFPAPMSVIIPKSNQLLDYETTQLRCGTLLALSTIRARNGETPLEVINLLLNFVEFNDNCGSGTCEQGLQETKSLSNMKPAKVKKSSVDSSGPDLKDQTSDNESSNAGVDDRHYCAILCYCLYNVRVAKRTPHHQFILQKIISLCKYFIESERIMSLHEEQSNDGFITAAEISFGSNQMQGKCTQRILPGGGILTAAAMQAICSAEIQLGSPDYQVDEYGTTQHQEKQKQALPADSAFNFRSYFISSHNRKTNPLTGTSSSNKYIPNYSAIVRSSALDCYLKLCFARYLSRTQYMKSNNVNAVESPKISQKSSSINDGQLHKQKSASGSSSQSSNSNPQQKLNSLISDVINTVCHVIKHEASTAVKRNAALSLLSAVQFKQSSYMLQTIISQNEHTGCFYWCDVAGYANMEYLGAKCHTQCAKELSEYCRQAMNRTAGSSLRSALRNFWNTIVSSPACAFDQCIRSTLLSVWLYCFRRVHNGKQRPPKALQTENIVAKDDVGQINLSTVFAPPTNIADPFFANSLHPSRMHIVNPAECSAHLNEFVFYGGYSKDVVVGRYEVSANPSQSLSVHTDNVDSLDSNDRDYRRNTSTSTLPVSTTISTSNSAPTMMLKLSRTSSDLNAGQSIVLKKRPREGTVGDAAMVASSATPVNSSESVRPKMNIKFVI